MKKKKFLLLLLWLSPCLLQAQSPVLPDDETSRHLKHEAVVGGMLHQNGWGFFFRRGTHLTGYKKKMLEVEAVTMTHPKESSIINAGVSGASSFVYGKLNSLLILRTGYGIQKVMYSKADRSGVEIKYNFYGGVSWGITKPVFLDILHFSSSPPYDYDIRTEEYDPQKHPIDSIYGKASFGNGLSQLALHPGLYGKFGLNFEYGHYDDVVTALEIGLIADAYLKPIPIMAYIPNNNIYFSVYIAFMYGGRW
jgi:hypothetical protein